MRRNGFSRGKYLSGTCLLASFLVGSLFGPPLSAQTADAYRNRATELAHAKSWDDAITNYRKALALRQRAMIAMALALEPNDAATHYNLALTLKGKGESREALKEFQAALKLRPKWADAHYGIAAVWYELQERDFAIKELRAAEALDPSNAATHRLLARILAQQNILVDAEHELKLALRFR